MRSAHRRSAWRASTPISASTLIIVFARAPVAGRVKTRLGLEPHAAAQLQRRLVRAALHTAHAARCGAVEVHVTRRHAFFRMLGVRTREQRGSDLGGRMRRALEQALRRHRNAILMGADCPALRPADLRQSARWLQGGADVVLAPAQDGGYALIGARRLAPGMFERLPWGSSEVYRETLGRLARAGLRWRALRTVRDVDRPQDLGQLRSLGFSAAARRARRGG